MRMRLWQAVVVLLLAAAAGFLVVTHPPHTSTATTGPVPTMSATLVFVGDIMLSRDVGALMAAKNDWTWPFAKIASVTSEADLAFGNLETTISTKGTSHGCKYCFRSDPRVMAGLVSAGFDVVSVANNHVWDYGVDAFTDTLQYLATSNISAAGGGRNLDEARGPIVRLVGGQRIAYLAYTDLLLKSAGAGLAKPGVNLYDPARMAEDIARAKILGDIVIVSFHTGTEYSVANEHQRLIYEGAIDAGADLVVGHHPHVVQKLQHYHNGWIAYSLGNFVFDQNFSIATMTGMMLTAEVSEGHIVSVSSRSVGISRQYQPVLAEDTP